MKTTTKTPEAVSSGRKNDLKCVDVIIDNPSIDAMAFGVTALSRGEGKGSITQQPTESRGERGF